MFISWETTTETVFELDLQYIILAGCVKQIETYAYNVTFLKNDGANYPLRLVIEIY